MSPGWPLATGARNRVERRPLRWGRRAFVFAVAVTFAFRATAAEFLAVTIGSDETIRQVAEKYLSDPDLWPEILRSSGIDSIADLKPGMELKVPVNEITEANKALIEALGQIQKANAAGAQIFAPDELGRAVDLHEQALKKRLARDWVVTRDLATASFAEAVRAYDTSIAKRDQAAEALVSDRAGTVEGQRPEDLSWRDLSLRAILIEEEKVRTLSDSTAQITFRDASRLRLNANSNAVIKVMRFDPLNRAQEAKVTLIEGDFYALLADGGEKTKFNVELPQVDAVIDSGNFWVSNDSQTAKFANYDDKAVSVAAGGETVTLGRNEGTIVDRGSKPREKIDVLGSPTPLAPANNGPVYVVSPTLSWNPVEGSAGYWVEVASDQNFDRIVESGFGVEEPQHTTIPLGVGQYFWRVSALDSFGLPGARSATWRFTVAPDNTPPYLKIDAPGEAVILREASVDVTGESEPDAKVTVNGADTAVGSDGQFSATITATTGDNVVTVVSTDPAGNVTTAERRFVHMPDEASVVAVDASVRTVGPSHFLTNTDVLSLSGRTTANAEVLVKSGDATQASAVADAGGLFRINVPLTANEQSFDIAVVAPSGFTTTEPFKVTIDRDAPQVAFDSFPPRLTADSSLRLLGITEPDATLTLNGRPVTLANGRFDETVTLQPGDNLIELIATDAAGNVLVDKSTVRLDQEAPKLVSAKGEAAGGGKPVLMIEVTAEDASGLAKAAPFVVTAGDRSYPGYLRYNKAAKAYQGTLVVPEADLATARLSRVELEDDAGNSQSFEIQN